MSALCWATGDISMLLFFKWLLCSFNLVLTSDVDIATGTDNFVYVWTLEGYIIVLKFGEYGRYLLFCVVNRVYVFIFYQMAYFVSATFYVKKICGFPRFLLQT